MSPKPYVFAALAGAIIFSYSIASTHARSAASDAKLALKEQNISQAFVNEFVKADDAALNMRMTTGMRTFMSGSVRRKLRTAIGTDAGRLVRIVKSDRRKIDGIDTISMYCQFAKLNVAADVAFDDNLKVTAFTIAPANDTSVSPATHKDGLITPAKSFVARFLSGDDTTAASMMTPQMLTMFTPKANTEFRSAVSSSAGQFVQIVDAKQSTDAGMNTVDLRCRFEKSDVRAAVTFDGHSKVAAFALTPWK